MKKNNTTLMPTLKSGGDVKVAEKLGELIREAQDGVRRILACGFYLDWIASQLPHGALGPWIKAHQEEVGATWQTVNRWRSLASDVAENCGFKLNTRVQFGENPRLVLMSADKLPEEFRSIRKKMDHLIEGKSATQLFFQFKEATEDGSKVRRPGGYRPAKALAEGEEVLDPELPSEVAKSMVFEPLGDLMKVWSKHWMNLEEDLLRLAHEYLDGMAKQARRALEEGSERGVR